jgi:hypothetical protein
MVPALQPTTVLLCGYHMMWTTLLALLSHCAAQSMSLHVVVCDSGDGKRLTTSPLGLVALPLVLIVKPIGMLLAFQLKLP